MDIKYSTDTKIEDNSRLFKLQKANFDKEVNSAVSRRGPDIASMIKSETNKQFSR